MTALIAEPIKESFFAAPRGRSMFLFFVSCLALSCPCLYGDTPDWVKDSTWAIAIGRFHPVILHLPIGCFFAAIGLEVFTAIRRPDNKHVETLQSKGRRQGRGLILSIER